MIAPKWLVDEYDLVCHSMTRRGLHEPTEARDLFLENKAIQHEISGLNQRFKALRESREPTEKVAAEIAQLKQRSFEVEKKLKVLLNEVKHSFCWCCIPLTSPVPRFRIWFTLMRPTERKTFCLKNEFGKMEKRSRSTRVC